PTQFSTLALHDALPICVSCDLSTWSAIQQRDIVPGAQTVRRGGAGPVGVLLRGRNPPAVSFGSETCCPLTDHQSGPNTSPPEGVDRKSTRLNSSHQIIS